MSCTLLDFSISNISEYTTECSQLINMLMEMVVGTDLFLPHFCLIANIKFVGGFLIKSSSFTIEF